MEEKKNGLGLGSLVSISTGTVVGAGVVSLLGVAMLMTGASSWLAYAAAVVAGLIVISPYILLCTTMRIKGGNYSYVSAVLGDFWGGMYGLCFTMVGLAMGLFGMSLGTYVKLLIPGINVRIFAMCAVTAFYILNLFGVNIVAKVEKAMFWFLMGGLLLYIIMGFTKMTPATMTLNDPEFFSAGVGGFISAIVLLMFSTTGQSYVVAFSREARNPKRDIPLAILITTGIIFLLYTGVGFVTCNILPVSEVAGQNLAVVAREIMPSWLYYVFIICAPIFAIFTTMNSSFVTFSRPLETMVKDGFFPASWAKNNKHGVPYILITFIYIIGMLPLVLNFSMGAIVDDSILIESIAEILAIVAVMRFPKKIEGAWENRYWKFSKGFFYTVLVLALAVRIALVVNTCITLTPAIAIVTVVAAAVFAIYSYLRCKAGKVKIIKSYELQ